MTGAQATARLHTDPELLALLERVKSMPPMTPRQHAEQRRSYVRGEMGIAHPEMDDAALNALLLNIPEFALLAELDRAHAATEAMRAALEEIARQKTCEELNGDEMRDADFEGAWDSAIRVARAALVAAGGEGTR